MKFREKKDLWALTAVSFLQMLWDLFCRRTCFDDALRIDMGPRAWLWPLEVTWFRSPSEVSKRKLSVALSQRTDNALCKLFSLY